MDNFIFGRYLPLNSWIHRMDPRAKLVLSFFFIMMVFFANNWAGYLWLTVVTFATITLSKIKVSYFLKGIRPLFWLIVFTVLIQVFFSPAQGVVYWQWGPFTISQYGLVVAGYVFVRFMLIIMISTLMMLSTPPLDISSGIASLLTPLKYLRVPVDTLAMMISIALRFVPTLMDEATKIMNAQRARGVDFNSGKLMQRIRALTPLLVPLFTNAFKRAEDLANAMEARGYQNGAQRSQYRILTWQRRDTISTLVYVAVFAILLGLRLV